MSVLLLSSNEVADKPYIPQFDDESKDKDEIFLRKAKNHEMRWLHNRLHNWLHWPNLQLAA